MISGMKLLDLYHGLAVAGLIAYIVLGIAKIIVNKFLLESAIIEKLSMDDDDPDFDRSKYENPYDF